MGNTNKWQQIVAAKDARIAELEALVKFYEGQFKLSKIRQFGVSSEKDILDGQLGLFNEAELTAGSAAPGPELEEITYKRRKTAGKREDDLSALPVEVVEHKLSEDERHCPECGYEMHEMGHDVARRELKIIPAVVKVVEHERAVYSCRHCEKNGLRVPIVKAPVPGPVIKGSLASPSSVAHVITRKYVMCAPLYRQEQDFRRQGVALSRQTMANWVIRCAEDWLYPLYGRMRDILLTHENLHVDESSLQVLKEPGKPPTSKSYMWLYRTGGDTGRHIVLFEYQPSRSGEHPKRFLSGFSGLLHSDGYAVYHSLPKEITVIGCWVHMRRKFTDALKTIAAKERPGSVAQEAICRIGKLFWLEKQWKNLKPEDRHRLRLEKSKPLAEAFFRWLETLIYLPKSVTGKAINYALDQRGWLMNVYLDGRTEISNNRAENAVRPYALGRRNWLFCNTVKGAQASAVIYSIIETAKENGLKPFEYLEFLLESMPTSKMGHLDALLPWGEDVPEHCRMPVRKGEVSDAEEKWDKFYDGICSGILKRGA